MGKSRVDAGGPDTYLTTKRRPRRLPTSHQGVGDRNMAEETEALQEQSLKIKNLDAVYDIPVQVSMVLGKVRIPISKLMNLKEGAVVELDNKVGEPIEIYVNRKLVARGDLIVSDGRLGVTLTEITRSNLGKP